MMPKVPIIQRAFEIASSGKVPDVTTISRRLVKEGYDPTLHLAGRAIRRQLRDAIFEAREGKAREARRLSSN